MSTNPALPPLNMIPRDVAAVSDYARYSRQRLNENAWTFLSAGAADEITLRDNRVAFDRLRLRSRVLSDVRGGNTRCQLWGTTYAHPIALAPVGYQRLFHPDGETASALAANLLGAPFIVSTLASIRLEALTASNATLWFQLYLQKHREDSLALVRRAEACGCKALVVTVDAPIAGIRNREQRAGFHLPSGIEAVNVASTASEPLHLPPGASEVFDGLFANAPGWQDIAWLRSVTRLPLIVKGILDPVDAELALRNGADGIIVSNHGGRVLDTLPATLDALPGVVAAVSGRVPVLLDGGIQRGSDVFKAIACGAHGVLIGRGYIHALATAGALGVAHVLRTLREELEVCMALTGCRSLDDIDATRLF